jgi:uncharacterized membrane protein YgdD (TMEM256/DUF423 family)
MPPTAKLFLMLGTISGACAVALGAFGAHGLKNRLTEEMITIYKTGVEYHFYHTFALLAVGLAALYLRSGLLSVSGWCFALGILIFSGSLYVLSISGIRALGAITPIGGLFFIAGWVLLAVAIMKGFDTAG